MARLRAPIALGVPVTASRQWTTALAPRGGGGWMFITQSWSNDEDTPTEWILVSLEDGAVTIQEGANRIYSNTNFQIASANSLITTTNQLRASNGRIFFPQRSTPGIGNDDTLNVAYYDPNDEQIHQLPGITDPTGARHQIVFEAEFGTTGDLIYCGTQGQTGALPMVFTIDPVTLATEVLCSVGEAASANVKFAYYLAKDATDYLYVAIGQDPWELVSIDLATNTPTVLLTTSGPGFQTLEFETRANGWSVNTWSNGVQARYWLADGAITPYPGSGAPPGGARTVTRYTNPLVSPPQIDHSRGIGELLWRPNGSAGAWTEIEYAVSHRNDTDLESLLALADGTILGNAAQYGGFFRHDPRTGETDWFGAWAGGVSRPVLCQASATEVYIVGYPSGALYRFNPASTWNVASNPVSLGSFGTAIRYPTALVLADNGKLYAAGRLERDALGSGVGCYDPDAHVFTTTTSGLGDFAPRGFVALPGLIVYSGEVRTGAESATEAVLITYDYDLAEQHRWTVATGMQNTGLLFTAPEPTCVIGLTTDAPVMLYKFDCAVGAPIASVHLGSVTIGATAVGPDGAIYAAIDGVVTRIDPRTLAREPVLDVSGL